MRACKKVIYTKPKAKKLWLGKCLEERGLKSHACSPITDSNWSTTSKISNMNKWVTEPRLVALRLLVYVSWDLCLERRCRSAAAAARGRKWVRPCGTVRPSVCLSTRSRPRPSTVINILQAFDNLRHLSSRCPEPFSKLPFIRADLSGDGEDRQPRERRLTFLLTDFGSFCARLISGNVLRGGQKYRQRNK